MQARFRPKSPLARAVLPVAGGIVLFGLVTLVLWGIAAFLSGNPDQVEERLANPAFEVGNTEYLSGLIQDDGPLLFQGLVGDAADRSIVLDHTGNDPGRGWTVRYAFPADRDDTCKVSQVRGTRQFTDCDGRTLEYEDLTRPERVRPLVSDVIIIDLRGAAEDSSEGS